MSQVKALPLGWKWVKLKELCEVVTGTTPSKNNSEYYSNEFPFYKPTDLEAGENVIYSRDSLSGLGIKAARYVPEGSTLVTCIGATIGKTGFIKKGGAFNQQINAIIPSNNFHPKFIYYQTISPHFQKQIKDNASSTTLPIINKGKFEVLSIVLPPLSIQAQIVEKLEALLSELDKGKAQLLTAQAQLKTYRQAVLKYAFEGKLTGDTEGWQWVKLGDKVKCVVPNRDKPKSFSGNIAWLTTPNFKENSISIDYSKITQGLTKEESILYKAKVIPVNSVIMTCVGTFGIAAVLKKEVVINQQLHAFLPSELFLPKFIAYNIINQKAFCESKSTSTTVAYLNKENCNSIPIPFVPLSTQQKIVTEIERRLSVCDKLEETLKVSLAQCETLRQSLLKRAFEGKLI